MFDGPSLAFEKPFATMGEARSLPPFPGPRRAAAEAGLKPLAQENHRQPPE